VRINLIKNISPTPPNARDDQPRTSVPQLSLRRSVSPPGRGPLPTPFLGGPVNAVLLFGNGPRSIRGPALLPAQRVELASVFYFAPAPLPWIGE
jgi:hypothetical protein